MLSASDSVFGGKNTNQYIENGDFTLEFLTIMSLSRRSATPLKYIAKRFVNCKMSLSIVIKTTVRYNNMTIPLTPAISEYGAGGASGTTIIAGSSIEGIEMTELRGIFTSGSNRTKLDDTSR